MEKSGTRTIAPAAAATSGKINDGGMTSGPPAVSGAFVDTYVEHDQQHFAYPPSEANKGALSPYVIWTMSDYTCVN